MRTFGRDVPPVPLVELNLSCGRLADELLHVVGPEGRVSTEHDVCDDPAYAQPQMKRNIRGDTDDAGQRCTHPVDQMSTALPWPFLLSTSGAT